VLAVLWAAATVLAFAAAWLLRPMVLRPTRQLAAAIATLGPDDLAARVPAAAAPVEMQTVVERLNGLLDRLEQAFRREQATIANIAHELRTPVATLRAALEFRLLAATADADRAGINELLATVERMQAQVSNLLLLARLEAGKEPLPRSEVDLGDLASEAAERWEARSGGRPLICAVAGEAPVLTSPDHLGLVLDNLIGNAIAHGSAGAIEVAVRVADGRAVLTVANAFTGTLDAAQLGQAYYRGDSARRADDHSGLGLALCQRLCRLLGATFGMTTDGGRFIATVALPVVGRNA
jgi:signal transduction histidine kinase